MTGTMRDKDTISKGPKKRDPACLQMQETISIVEGTILRQESGKEGIFVCPLEFGKLVVTDEEARKYSHLFKRVVA